MNEQNRQRVGRMTRRLASRLAQGASETESDTAFIAEFGRIRDEVLRPVMDELGAQLREGGYESSVANDVFEASPAIDFRIVIPGRDDSKDTIRFFAHKDALRGWQVIAEIELKRSPIELTRFDAGDPITRDVAEQLLVDATEQVFASALAAPRVEATSRAAASAPASPPRAQPAEGISTEDTLPSGVDGEAVGVRALVLQRLRAGRVLHGLDLVGADLHDLDFTGTMMPVLDLRDANLRGCRLVGARLMAAKLAGADLTGADLTGADLARADLSRAVLEGACLEGAKLDATIGLPAASSEEPAAREPEPAAEEVPAEPVEAPPAEPLPELALLPPMTDAPEARWARWAGAQEMGETEEVDVSVFRGAALPFAKGPPSPAFFAAANAARSGPRPPRASADGYETMALPVLALPAAPGEAGGVDGPRLGPAELTVEQYAAFCAELKVFPGQEEGVWRRYGLVNAQLRAALEADFARRFQEDATLRRKWEALVAHYGAWYRRQKEG